MPSVDGCHQDAPVLMLKVGTSTLVVSDAAGQRVSLSNVAQLVEVIATLRRRGYRVVLVSSGAVAMGCIKLGLAKRPSSVRRKQAVAAAGQSYLMRMFEDMFGTARMQVAQILVNQSDFLEKAHWANVQNTLMECLKLGVVPVINENDTTNTEELRFGDNDNLAALMAVQLKADGLFIFTDVDYLYTADPRADATAKPLRVVCEPWSLHVDTRSSGSGLGTGGMSTKIAAARTASCAGIPCSLIHGAHPQRILAFLDARQTELPRVANGEICPWEGTYFKPMDVTQKVNATRRWILSLPIAGELVINDGAAAAVADHKNLLAAGVLSTSGQFSCNQSVRLVHNNVDVGRAIVDLSADVMDKILGSSGVDVDNLLSNAAFGQSPKKKSARVLRSPMVCSSGNTMLMACSAVSQLGDSSGGEDEPATDVTQLPSSDESDGAEDGDWV